jgi:hypothetical protein
MWTKCGVECLDVNVSCTYRQPRVFNSDSLSHKLGLRQFYFSALKFLSLFFSSFLRHITAHSISGFGFKQTSEWTWFLGEFSLTHHQTNDAQKFAIMWLIKFDMTGAIILTSCAVWPYVLIRAPSHTVNKICLPFYPNKFPSIQRFSKCIDNIRISLPPF